MSETTEMAANEAATKANSPSLLAIKTKKLENTALSALTLEAHQEVTGSLPIAADPGMTEQILLPLNDGQVPSSEGECRFQSLPTLILADNPVQKTSCGLASLRSASPLLSTGEGPERFAHIPVTGQHTTFLAGDEAGHAPSVSNEVAESRELGIQRTIATDTSIPAYTRAEGKFMAIAEDAFVASAASMAGLCTQPWTKT
jgi:hypothetical protein